METKTQSVILGLSSKIPVKCDIDFFTSQYKIWVKPSGEQSFLYGNHILKSGLGRITENTPQYQGVIVYSMNDLPLVSELNSRISVSRKYSFPFSSLTCNRFLISLSSNNFALLEVKIWEKLCCHLKVFVWVGHALNIKIVYKIHHSAKVKQCFWAEL